MSEVHQDLGSERADGKPDAGGQPQEGVEMTRRRLLRLTAYAAPFVLTFGMPKSSDAFCNPGSPTGGCFQPKWPAWWKRCWWFWFR